QRLNAAPWPQRLEVMQKHFPAEALKWLNASDLDKELGPYARQVEMIGIQIRLRAGMLEDALAAMTALQAKLKMPPSEPQAHAINNQVSQQLVGAFAEAQQLAGDYAAYGQWLDKPYTPPPPLTPAMKEMSERAC